MSQFYDFLGKKQWMMIKIKCILFIDHFYVDISAASRRTPAGMTMDLFEQHQGTHILQVRIIHLTFFI